MEGGKRVMSLSRVLSLLAFSSCVSLLNSLSFLSPFLSTDGDGGFSIDFGDIMFVL